MCLGFFDKLIGLYMWVSVSVKAINWALYVGFFYYFFFVCLLKLLQDLGQILGFQIETWCKSVLCVKSDGS